MSTPVRPLAIRRFALGAAVALALVASLSSRIGTAVPASAPDAADAVAQVIAADGVLRFDVAEDATRFAWLGEPAPATGLPADGVPFVARGYVYPAGTLSAAGGVRPDGSPEFPDRVLGAWAAYGWGFGGDAHVERLSPRPTIHRFGFGAAPDEATVVSATAPWLTVHLFRFGGAWGTGAGGGHGPSTAVGVLRETPLGRNAAGGRNGRFKLRLAEPLASPIDDGGVRRRDADAPVQA